MNLAPQIARIILRYVSGALVAYGAFSPDTGEMIAADPDLALVLGTVLGAGVEAAFAVAVKKGWVRDGNS